MKFQGTAIQFDYNPSESEASCKQVNALLEGFGYEHVMLVRDDYSPVITAMGLKYRAVALDGNKHEVAALRRVLAQDISVDYYHVKPTDKLTVTA
jgi:hypothetical protein